MDNGVLNFPKQALTLHTFNNLLVFLFIERMAKDNVFTYSTKKQPWFLGGISYLAKHKDFSGLDRKFSKKGVQE